MNANSFYNLFSHYIYAIKNLQKVSVANAQLRVTKGGFLWKKSRKYRPPVEDTSYSGLGPKDKIKAMYQSLKARGFGKELPSYNPPQDLEEKLYIICKNVYGSNLVNDWKNQNLDDSLLKYKFLTKSIEVFKHDVPNSYLHTLTTIQDVYNYFNTPIEGSSHYDILMRESDKLPKNLHVMEEAQPFDPASDTFFDGVTAFPGRKRIVFTKTGEKFEKTIQWPNI